jgi:hypothetical protein
LVESESPIVGGELRLKIEEGKLGPADPRDAADETLRLLASRATDATICPSEVARALVAASGDSPVAGDWRDAMPLVHAAVDRLAARGSVRLSWKGVTLATRIGPYRIGRALRS